MLGGAHAHDLAATDTTLGAQVDDVVGHLDEIGVVLDHHHRVARVDQPLQRAQQGANVLEVQSRGGLVEQVQRRAGVGPLQLGCELDPLRLAAGQGRARLPQCDVAQADIHQGLEHPRHPWNGREQLERLADGHRQHVGDGVPLPRDVEGLGVEPLSLADLARHLNRGQELHLDDPHPSALAGVAAAAGDVEREPALLVPAGPRLRRRGEQVADAAEGTSVRGGVGPGRTPDGGLGDANQLVDPLGSDQPAAALGPLAVEVGPQAALEDPEHQAGLARAAHPGHHREAPQRKVGIDRLQVVGLGPAHPDPPGGGASRRWQIDAALAPQVLGGEAALAAQQLLGGARGHDLAALAAGPGTHVDHVVGGQDGLGVVFDHQHRVSAVAELAKRIEQPAVVAGVQADGRLVEHVGHALQRGAHLSGEADALGLATGQRRRAAVQSEVPQAHLEQEREPPTDLVEQLLTDVALGVAQLHRGEQRVGVFDTAVAELGKRPPAKAHRPGHRVESLAVAAGARLANPEPLEAAVAGVSVDLLDQRQQTAPRPLALLGAGSPLDGHGEDEGRIAVEQLVLQVCGPVLHLLAGGGAELANHHRQVAAIEVGERQAPLGVEPGKGVGGPPTSIHDPLGVEGLEDAQAVAGWAGPLGGVEREQTGLELGDRDLGMVGTGPLGGERLLALRVVIGGIGPQQRRGASPERERGLESLGEPWSVHGVDLEAIDHDLDGVLLVAGQRWGGIEGHDLAVDASAHPPVASQPVQLFAVLALALLHHRTQDPHPLTIGGPEDSVDHVVYGQPRHLGAALGTVWGAQPRHEQPQVIVELGDGAHGGAWVAVGRLLIDGQRGGHAID